MVNSVRTFLANVTSNNSLIGVYPFEEYIPPEFHPVPLSKNQKKIYSVLFGCDKPDRMMVNYMCRSYLRILHNIFPEYMVSSDNRITYLKFSDDEVDREVEAIYKNPVSYSGISNNSGKIIFTYDFDKLTNNCNLKQGWFVKQKDSNSISIYQQAPGSREQVFSVNFTNNFSEPITLVKDKLIISIEDRLGAEYLITAYFRPSFGINHVISKIDNVIGPNDPISFLGIATSKVDDIIRSCRDIYLNRSYGTNFILRLAAILVIYTKSVELYYRGM
ncbi:MAG: hypothetical protein QXT45_05980 [Candidatus Bilamarchaeaceae archaeon]